MTIPYTPGILFLLTLVFGFWLSSSGRPYNLIIFNVHKLIALGMVIVAGIQISRMLGNAEPLALIVLLPILAGIGVVMLFASGALMSAGKLSYHLMLTVHRIGPVIVLIALALVLYLLR